ncbi:SUPPRESSOR OF ABI3-5-like [Camellia sinensis]|uniref:SUPPRESSOR OF ABI3-5-like n=1 Tax=Camellia sinensis TaxID=4442 RepID=UPI00103642B3|nr:SUPPRESSOR OF ABI3-5-like [Camellia sinensis]
MYSIFMQACFILLLMNWTGTSASGVDQIEFGLVSDEDQCFIYLFILVFCRIILLLLFFYFFYKCAGLYYDGNNGVWYSYDHQTQQYVPYSDQSDNKTAGKQNEQSKGNIANRERMYTKHRCGSRSIAVRVEKLIGLGWHF